MCTMYWNYTTTFICPTCEAAVEDDLQTHFMGEIGSCSNYYTAGERVHELGDFTGELPTGDEFIGACSFCSTLVELPARISCGKVVSVG